MKRVKLYFVAATLVLATATLFAFNTNKKLGQVSTLYFGTGTTAPQIATGASGFWFDNSNGGNADLATLEYGSNTEIITYDKTNQVFFQP